MEVCLVLNYISFSIFMFFVFVFCLFLLQDDSSKCNQTLCLITTLPTFHLKFGCFFDALKLFSSSPPSPDDTPLRRLNRLSGLDLSRKRATAIYSPPAKAAFWGPGETLEEAREAINIKERAEEAREALNVKERAEEALELANIRERAEEALELSTIRERAEEGREFTVERAREVAAVAQAAKDFLKNQAKSLEGVIKGVVSEHIDKIGANLLKVVNGYLDLGVGILGTFSPLFKVNIPKRHMKKSYTGPDRSDWMANLPADKRTSPLTGDAEITHTAPDPIII